MVICVLCIIMLMWLSSLGQSVEQYRADFGSDTVDYVRFMQKNAGILYLDYLFQIFVGVVSMIRGTKVHIVSPRMTTFCVSMHLPIGMVQMNVGFAEGE